MGVDKIYNRGPDGGVRVNQSLANAMVTCEIKLFQIISTFVDVRPK